MIKNASKDTLFGKAEDTLSIMASLLSDFNTAEEEGYEDIRAFHAPSECGKQVKNYYDFLRATLYWEYDITEEEFFAAVAERTSEKWIHFHSNLL